MVEKCWICGNKSKLTGEHLTKKSDLKAEFQQGSLYWSSDKSRNVKIQSANSDKLKSSAKICAYCNNERTQPHDRAWEKLSSFLKSIAVSIRTSETIFLDEVFPEAMQVSMLNVHLFFVKLFGCKVLEGNIPIDIRPFSAAILKNKPHNNVYIAICPKLTGHVGHTDLHAIKNHTGKIVFMVWYYELCDFSIRVMFAEQGQSRDGLRDTWHPSTIGEHIKIASLS